MNKTRTLGGGRGAAASQKGNRVSKPLPRRRPPKVDTEQMAVKRACARHLTDLRRWHAEPPPDVKVNMRGIPKLVPPILEQSYCTSPAALCADLADPMGAELAEHLAWAELGESFN